MTGIPDADPDPVNSRADRTAMYEVAYEEAKRTLDDQIAEIDSMRQRAVQFLAFVGTASGFLIGTALHNPNRSALFYVLSIAATVCAIVALRLAINVLTASPQFWGMRKTRWTFRLSAHQLESWVSGENAAPSRAHFYRALAATYDRMARDNEDTLSILRQRYSLYLVLAVLQLLLWISLVWIFA